MDFRRERKTAMTLLLVRFVALVAMVPCSCFQFHGGGAHLSMQWRGVLDTSACTRSSSFAGDCGERDWGAPRRTPWAKGKRHGSQACTARGVSMSTINSASTISGIRGFFDPSSISSAMSAANNLPPVYYFLYLMAAGVGVPVSEDVLLIFVGTMLGNADFTTSHKVACVAWCYAGVVVSDLMTYSIGCGFRRGMFNPLRRILLKDPKDDNSVADGAQALPAGSKNILERIRRSGRYVGVAERFAVGARGPMSLLCGFTGVPLRGFATGVALGALFGTVPIQLALGYALRNRPAAVAAIGASFISYYAFGPPLIAAIGGATLWLGRRRERPRDGRQGNDERQNAGGEGRLELGEDGAGI